MIPVVVRAAFDMLRGQPAPQLASAQWDELIAFTDRTQLTLYFRQTPGLPAAIVDQIEARRSRNILRRERLRGEYAEIARALDAAGIPFAVLKGFTHERGFGIDPTERVQYDLDLLFRPKDTARTRQALLRIGYRPHGQRSLSEEHSRPLVKPFNWRWRGDYFDPEMPIAVELHGSLWDRTQDRIAVDNAGVWKRRTRIDIGGLSVPALGERDRVGFAALHVLRHVLRNDARPAHAFELARWFEPARGMRQSPAHNFSLFESAGLRFAAGWFGAPLSPALPAPIEHWFRDYAWSPIENLVTPNKDAVWLHLALLDNWRDRAAVLAHRLTPFRLPHSEASFRARLRYHAAAFAPALFSGLRWALRRETASRASQISDWNRRSV